ncbi:MAG: anaerobic glycerol-3-phosphate dehydrogenase subunit C [Planctomycetales bacterium]|nr:anaerobic glycerol-3-phosphate dehydrogenase subunit C [Planctomycetales bacterium]
MDPEQTRIQADLRGLIDGEVFCNSIYAQMYASDASIHEIRPLGVVRPRHSSDVSKTLSYCLEHGISVFPRGGGSGLAGQSLGRGVVLDFSRFMRRIHTPYDNTVRVQAGVVQADLNRSLGLHGLLFGPDPATRSVSAIGSMLSVDAAGSHFPRYGSAGDCVESLQIVLASGQQVELGRHRWALDRAPVTDAEALASQVGLLLQQNSALILRPPWSGDIARGCGYRIEKTLDGDEVNLARLICGSEGTLGIITEATLRLAPIPKVRGLMLMFFARLDTAARAVLALSDCELSACDLMDRRLLEIARETEPVYASIVPRGAEAMLLIEYQGEQPSTVRSRLLGLLERLQRRNMTVISYRLTADQEERNLLWRLARRVIPRLYRLKGNQRPLPFVEDVSIPPKRLPEFLVEVQNVLKVERATATVFAHALHGQVDLRPFLDLADRSDQQKLARLSETLYQKVIDFGGCVSGEQAFGLTRAAWAEKQLGPRLELCRRIKQVFDPQGILNPGKFLSPTPPTINENLRPVPAFRPKLTSIAIGKVNLQLGNSLDAATAALGDATRVNQELLIGDIENFPFDESLPAIDPDSQIPDPNSSRLPVILQWPIEESVEYTSRSCNGCGRCRTSASAERMCPVFRVHKGEESSPRAKANLMRSIITGVLPYETLQSNDLKEIADLCFNCHQCRQECPASVNIPKLVQEIKSQYVANNGLPLGERMLSRLDLLASLGSQFPRMSNWALQSPFMRWVLEKAFGIAQGRKLPKVSRRTFLRWASRQKLTRLNRSPGRKVLYFVDQYVNWHNPLLGRALVEVLQHQNVEIYIPAGQTPSWMAMIAAGDIGRARKMLKTNVRILSEAVRYGYEIVTTEPSAALCLKEEYLNLFKDEDTELISKHTYEACSYLWSMHLRNELELDFRPVSMSMYYHEPCHARVLDARQPALNLLQLIPGLQVTNANAGCSGMAGTFGLKRQNYRTSLRIGWALISGMRETSAQLGTTECTACKLQMEQATPKPTVHPVAMLAFAYGRMPQLAAWFSSRNSGTVVF